MTKFQYIAKLTAVGSLVTIGIILMLHDRESLLPNIIGIAVFAVGGYLYERWNLKDYDKSDYSNEYFPNEQ